MSGTTNQTRQPMKAHLSKSETLEPAQRSDEKIAADIQGRIKSISALREKIEKDNADGNKLEQKIIALLNRGGATIRHGESYENMLSRCQGQVRGEDEHDLNAAVAKLAAGGPESQKFADEIKVAKQELHEIVVREGSRRDGELLAAHSALVEKIIEGILPFCDDAKEAKAVALGLNRPTQLHRRVAFWRRGIDDLSGAVALVKELSTEIPSV
jgi:hypothetical protein